MTKRSVCGCMDTKIKKDAYLCKDMRKLSIILGAMLLLLTSCEKEQWQDLSKPFDRVMILYAFGYNNLTVNMERNINEICEGDYVPTLNSRNAILVFAHFTQNPYDYHTPNDSRLIRIYKKDDGKVVRDTLMSISPVSIAIPEVMNTILSHIRENYDSEHYSLVLSGHGTAWLPQGAYDRRDNEYITASMGQERDSHPDGSYTDYFIDIPDFRKSVPMHLDHLILDLCLMGNVESVYEMRYMANEIVASPGQVPTSGFNYNRMAHQLLELKAPSCLGICDDFYQKSKYSSVTISYIRTSRLGELATQCSKLVDRYRDAILALDKSEPQAYCDSEHPWFFDLEDIFIKAGVPDTELAPLNYALRQAVPFQKATNTFFSIRKKHVCGLSMSLPQYIDREDIGYYRNLEWTKAISYLK